MKSKKKKLVTKKIYVFNFFLKMSMDGEDLTSLGKLFHNFGAHTENALSPKVVVLDIGYWNPSSVDSCTAESIH